jgi:hypothetical protein
VDVGHHSAEHGTWNQHGDTAGDLSHIPGVSQQASAYRIDDEMAKAYPDEHDFEIACGSIKGQQTEGELFVQQ